MWPHHRTAGWPARSVLAGNVALGPADFEAATPAAEVIAWLKKREFLGVGEVMSRKQSVSFYVDTTKELQHVVLIALLRGVGASLVRDGRIHAYVQTEDGHDSISPPCSEEQAFGMTAALFDESKIAAIDAEVNCEGRAMLFSFDPSHEGQIAITILGKGVELPDGMIDFNWY